MMFQVRLRLQHVREHQGGRYVIRVVADILCQTLLHGQVETGTQTNFNDFFGFAFLIVFLFLGYGM